MANSVVAIAIRMVTMLLTLAAVVVMARSHQSVELQNGLIYTVKFHYFGSFTYFLFANAICCIYNPLVAFLPDGSLLWRIVLVFDMVLAMVLSASVGTCWTYYNLLNQGNVNVPWGPICAITSAFCADILGAFILGVIGFCTHCFLLCFSVHNLFNPLLGPD